MLYNPNTKVALFKMAITAPTITTGGWINIVDLGTLRPKINTIERVHVGGKQRDFQLNGQHASMFFIPEDSGQSIMHTTMYILA